MNTDSIQHIYEMRMLVGYLGEKHQASWWDSSFLSSASKTFLAPIYPKSLILAQYNGVCQAASIVHDEHVGIGKHYHLYRLPDSIERALLKYLKNPELSAKITQFLSKNESAMGRLQELGIDNVERAEGPVSVGNYSDAKIDDLLKTSRSYYIDAFKAGYKAFPYMKCL